MNDSTRNPYAAPKAALKESPDPGAPRPRVVVVAVTLLWIDLGLGVVSTLIESLWLDRPAPNQLAIQLATSAAWVAFYSFLNLKIWAGIRWARTLTLVLVVLSTVGEFGAAISGGMPASRIAFDVAGFALDVIAFSLLLGPAREWFDRLE